MGGVRKRESGHVWLTRLELHVVTDPRLECRFIA